MSRKALVSLVRASYCSSRSFSASPKFDAEVARLYRDLSKGLQNLTEKNPGFQVIQDSTTTTIELGKNKGKYSFQKLDSEEQVSVISPKSGEHFYQFDDASGFWRSQGDDHIMLELLTRELLDLQGCPQF